MCICGICIEILGVEMRPSQLPSIRQFMGRNHSKDVVRLNTVLNRNGDAGLEDMPPIPFTGDIDAMEKDNCICVLGINPHWPAESRDAHQNEILPTRRMIEGFHEGEEQQYQSFIDSRLNYFRGNMANWVHYRRIGKGYAENFFEGETYQSVWDRNVFALDILPYWSADTGRISDSRLRKNITADPAMVQHQLMISEIIESVRPKLIHVNGTTARRLVEAFYCPEPMQSSGQEHSLMFGHARFGNTLVPVMAHQQFGSRNGPSSKHWPQFVQAFRDFSDYS